MPSDTDTTVLENVSKLIDKNMNLCVFGSSAHRSGVLSILFAKVL